jgi:iron complex transport system substrate-binding protein
MVGLVALVLTAVTPVVGVAQDATPSAGLALALTPGVVPTKYGDIDVPGDPQRVVTLTDGSLDAVLALGVTPVGTTVSSNGVGPAAYLADRVPESVEYVGGWGELDIEKIAALTPDLILTDRYVVDDVYATLSQIAPVVASGEIAVAGPDALQQWEYEQLIWGHALGKDAESLALIQDVRTRAAAVKGALGDRAGQSVVVFRPQPDFPVVMSHLWITGTVLTWCGLVGNELTATLPPPHSGRDISLEQLDVLDADWLFAAARNQEMVDALEVYKGYPLFALLPAVADGRVVLVNGDLWSGATGVLAAHAMIDEIEAILLGAAPATPTT